MGLSQVQGPPLKRWGHHIVREIALLGQRIILAFLWLLISKELLFLYLLRGREVLRFLVMVVVVEHGTGYEVRVR